MLELYYRPLACSLATRIALAEAGLPAVYRRVDLTTKRLDDGSDFHVVSAKAQVPVLRTREGPFLTEGAAVLQYVADLRPASGLAPYPTDRRRYELQAWLSFIATELHKAFLFPRFMNGTPDAVREHGRAHFEARLPYLSEQLERRPHLMGDAFGVADAYLFWALTLARFADVELPGPVAAYLERIGARPAVARALALELAELSDAR